MVNKKTKKSTGAKSASKSKTSKSTSKKESKSFFSIVWLRIALGLFFMASGIPKLMTLMSGGPDVVNFFQSLGIPAPAFFAWVVALVEVLGGFFLVIGFLVWWSSLLLAIIMVVAAMLTNVFSGFDLKGLIDHFVYFAGLVTLMLSKDLKWAVDKVTGWKEPKF
jgi:putative oxidoreductase